MPLISNDTLILTHWMKAGNGNTVRLTLVFHTAYTLSSQYNMGYSP
jgi:hypothetical protein